MESTAFYFLTEKFNWISCSKLWALPERLKGSGCARHINGKAEVETDTGMINILNFHGANLFTIYLQRNFTQVSYDPRSNSTQAD